MVSPTKEDEGQGQMWLKRKEEERQKFETCGDRKEERPMTDRKR